MGAPLDATDHPDNGRHVAGLPRPLAFVLSGGASSGATQVGMLRALRDAGIRPDIVVGTSVGAINGVMVAGSTDSGVDRLSDVWGEIDRDEILGSSSIRCLPRLFRTRRHLFPPDALRALIQRNLPVRRFDALPVRFAAVATHVAQGTPTLLLDGDIERALLASAAIPGIFPRVEIDGHWYFDGGVTANIPVRQAVELGARSVVVLDAAPPPADRDQPSNIAETLQHVAGLLMRSQISSDVSHMRGHCDLVELPRCTPQRVGPFDFSRSAELMERAYKRTRRFLTARHSRPSNRSSPATMPA
ncbi:MAG: patatin-like phospholipase family protein [Acidimicrobiia bacterium]|nr:patatin-like phospholipase family protein [Acidimicrobiia bacterium]